MVERYVAYPPSSDTPKLSAPTRLLYIQQPYANHNGGCLQFGPDGMLYVGMGDGGSAGDPQNRAQNLSQPLGKMLRLDVSGAKYLRPQGQSLRRARLPNRHHLGSRSSQSVAVLVRPTTDELWIGDVGQGAWEEIDVAAGDAKGLNYGWHKWEGTHPYPPDSPAPSRQGFTFPIVEYPHPTGESVTGGYVYRGSKFPALVGTYLYADYVKGWIAGVQRGLGTRHWSQRRDVDAQTARHQLQHQQLRRRRGQRALPHRPERRGLPRARDGRSRRPEARDA